jgi:glutamate racemase
LQRRYASDPAGLHRILGVTIPAAEAAVSVSAGHIGVIGTTRTISSATFVMEVEKLGPHRVSGCAAPLLAPIVEEGWEESDIARLAVSRYVSRFEDIDTLVLACTHYPLLMTAFREAAGPGVRVLDPSPFVAERLLDWLERHPGYAQPGDGSLSILCTGEPSVFREHGARFLGAELPPVQHVAEEKGRLARRDRVQVVVGQVVR